MKDDLEEFEVELNPEAPLYIIGVVSQMLEIPIWTLRKLDELGVVKPKRVGKTRCYSQNQIHQLNYVQYLMEEKKVNISGIKFILETKVTKIKIKRIK